MSPTTADRLSLTLPNSLSALKRRIRRPRKPTLAEAVFLGGSVAFAVWAAASIALSTPIARSTQMIPPAFETAVSTVYFHVYRELRRRRR